MWYFGGCFIACVSFLSASHTLRKLLEDLKKKGCNYFNTSCWLYRILYIKKIIYAQNFFLRFSSWMTVYLWFSLFMLLIVVMVCLYYSIFATETTARSAFVLKFHFLRVAQNTLLLYFESSLFFIMDCLLGNSTL